MNTLDRLINNDCRTPETITAISVDTAMSVAGVLKALADPLRLRMLSAIANSPEAEACVCDLQQLTDVSQPTVSHHLRVLKDTGILHSERRGTWVYYRVQPGQRAAVTTLLEALAPEAAGEQRTMPMRRSPTVTREHMDERVTHLANELVAEFTHIHTDLVTAIVRESYAGLARSATINLHLIPLVERFARQRLADLTRNHATSAPQVLFVCVANAGRSQLAAALTNQLSDGRVVARSAGSVPAATIHENVQATLAEITGGEEAQLLYPKPLTDDAVRAADVVITMGCGDVCPIIPGVRYEDWAVGDPALASPEGVQAIRADIEERVRTLITQLTEHRK